MKKRILGTRGRTVAAAVVVSGLGFAPWAAGQTQLKDVVVTATRVELPVADIVADVSIIERAEIERMSANRLTEVLGRLPGIQTSTHGGSSVYIRGAEARMTALYIDGVRVDSHDGLRLGGGAPWEMLPVSQIERIEIVRGPASAVYGSDAMGGVIQIFTKKGTGAFAPYVSVQAGSMDTSKFAAGFSGASSGWDYAFGLGYDDVGGYNTRPSVVHTPDREKSRQQSGSVRVGYQINQAHRAEFQALDSNSVSLAAPFFAGADTRTHSSLRTSAIKWDGQWSRDHSTRLSITDSAVSVTDTDTPANDYQTRTRGVALQGSARIGRGNLTALVEHRKDAFDLAMKDYGFGFFDPAVSAARTQEGVSLGYDWQEAGHGIQLAARSDHDSISGSKVTGSAGYAYRMTPAWRLTTGLATGFRAPTLEQLYSNYGNTGIAPESNQSAEVGVAYQAAGQSFKSTLYRNKFKNLITSGGTNCAAMAFCYFNVGLATVRGVSLSGSQTIDAYKLGWAFDWMDPRNELTGRVLSLRSARHATFNVDRRLGDWLLGSEVQAFSERFDNAANSVILGGYALLNVTASAALNREWQINARLNNLADKQYQQVGSFMAPGRAFYLTLKWEPKL